MDRLRHPHAARSKGRYAWARLNADAVLLAVLAVFAGFLSGVDPTFDRVTAVVGYPSIVHYAQAVAYLAGGLLLIDALLAASVRLEAVARTVILGALACSVWRHANVLGFAETATIGQIVLLAAFCATAWTRMSVIGGDDGLVVTRDRVEE